MPQSTIYKRPKKLGLLCLITLGTRHIRATLTENNRHQRIIYTGLSTLRSFYTSVTTTAHSRSQKPQELPTTLPEGLRTLEHY